MTERGANTNVKIVIRLIVAGPPLSEAEKKKIRDAVKNCLLIPSYEPYHAVLVDVIRRGDRAVRSIAAFMLRAYTYTADIARIDFDTRGRAKSAAFLVGDSIDEANVVLPKVAAKPSHSARKVDMVFGTPVPEIKSAKVAVEYAYGLARRLGYRAVKLLGNSANLVNYKKYLAGHLKAFGHVGHGYARGIVLSDGNLTYNWFGGLTMKPLSPAVAYFNSCQTFNPPLGPSVMTAGSRTFIGGNVNLLIGHSEEVFKCFWTSILEAKKPMRTSLRRCEKAHYRILNAHGFGGDSGRF